jgi:predicted nucleic acid-binding protein
MICADTSSLVALLLGEAGRDVDMVRQALSDRILCVSPISVTELLSDPDPTPSLGELVTRIPRLEISPGYWERAGELRAQMFRLRLRPKVADTLIAQSCLDHGVPLITRDRDFSSFQKIAGLQLLAMGDLMQ